MSQPPNFHTLAAKDTQFFGLDLGGTKCAASLLLGQGVEEFCRLPTADFASTFDALAHAIADRRDGRPIHIGISCGGPAEYAGGRIGRPPNLPSDWHGVAVTRELHARLGGTARMMNDANACALAEWMFGAGRGARHMIFITAGTGFGAGLILNGALYTGTTGDAGEIGHVRLAASGPLGYGKAGSVEGFCSGGGMARLATLMLAERAPACPPAWAEQPTARVIIEAARQGEPFAQAVVAESGRRLGEALAVLVDLFNPERIILGGLFPRCQDLWAPHWPPSLHREALPGPVEACRILPAMLGETIGSHGAIAAAVYDA